MDLRKAVHTVLENVYPHDYVLRFGPYSFEDIVDQVVFELRQHNSDKTVLNHVAFRVEIQDDVEALKAQGIVFKNKHKLIADTGRTVSGIMDYSGLNWQLTD